MENLYYIVPDSRFKTALISESSGAVFLCPDNTVMTGRHHQGDENGQTEYEYAILKAIDGLGNVIEGQISVEEITWHDFIKELKWTDTIYNRYCKI